MQSNLDLTPRYEVKCAAFICPQIPNTKGNKMSITVYQLRRCFLSRTCTRPKVSNNIATFRVTDEPDVIVIKYNKGTWTHTVEMSNFRDKPCTTAELLYSEDNKSKFTEVIVACTVIVTRRTGNQVKISVFYQEWGSNPRGHMSIGS